MNTGTWIRKSGFSTLFRKWKWFEIKIFDFYLLKSCRNSLMELLLKKIISKFFGKYPLQRTIKIELQLQLQSLSVMDNVLDIFQEFSVQEMPLSGCLSRLQVTQTYVVKVWFLLFYNWNAISAFQDIPRTNCLLTGRSKVNQGVGQQNL